MRHISFDESLVMNELVKIARDKGLVSEAEVPMPREMPEGDKPESIDIGPIETKVTEPPPVSMKKTTSMRDVVKNLHSQGRQANRLIKLLFNRLPKEQKAAQGMLNNLPLVMSAYAQKMRDIEDYNAHMDFIRGKVLAYLAPMIGPNAEKLLNAGFDVYRKQYEELVQDTLELAPADDIPRVGLGSVVEKTLAKYPLLQRIYSGAAPGGVSDLRSHYNQVISVFDKWIKDAMQLGTLVDASDVEPVAKKISEYFAKLNANVNPAHLMGRVQLASEKQGDSIKTAEGDKIYDVSGETGKDLVDEAHPGGGTRTELTHSKTDENLVETIVEQQDKDIEVAKKIPKGVYAVLVGLCEKLNKMGYGEYIRALEENMTFIKEADLADLNARRMKALTDATNAFIDKLYSMVPPMAFDLRDQIKSLRNQPYSPGVFQKALNMVSEHQPRWAGAVSEAYNNAPVDKYLSEAKSIKTYIKSKQAPGVAGEGARPQEEKVDLSKQPKLVPLTESKITFLRTKLQKLLGMEPTGKFDRATVRAIRQLEKDSGKQILTGDRGQRISDMMRRIMSAKAILRGEAVGVAGEGEKPAEKAPDRKVSEVERNTSAIEHALVNYVARIAGPSYATSELRNDIRSIIKEKAKHWDITNRKGMTIVFNMALEDVRNKYLRRPGE